MLTTEAFNALLKTLEEPPDACVFHVRHHRTAQGAGHHPLPLPALRTQASGSQELADAFRSLGGKGGHHDGACRGEMVVRGPLAARVRDGLSLLDQLFSYCGEQVSAADAAEVLGTVGGEVIAGTAKALLAHDLAAALERLETVARSGMDIKRFINELLAWFRSLVVCAISKDPAQVLDLPADELASLQETAASHSPQSLFLIFNLLMESLEKAAWSSRPRFAVEMAFIRAVQAEDVVPVTELLGRLDSILAGTPLPQVSEPSPLYEKKKTIIAEVNPPHHAEPVPASTPEPPPPPPLPDEPPHPAEQYQPAPKAAVGTRDIRKDWPDFIKAVQKPWLVSALERAASKRIEGGKLILSYDDSAECSTLKMKEQLAELTALASDFFQEKPAYCFR